MKEELAHHLIAAAEAQGVSGVEHQDDYSGRYMYGATTHAVVVDSINDMLVLVAIVGHDSGLRTASASADVYDYDYSEMADLDDLLIPELESIRMDNMGKGYVFY